MTAKVIDMKRWESDRLADKASTLTNIVLRSMTDERRERLMRRLERHIEIKTE